jgi:thioredoxin reductase
VRNKILHAVIIGAGPAGLSAALILGRACRSILVCDRGTPRNWASKAVYGFLSRDGIDPEEFRDIARRELSHYPNVEFVAAEVIQAARLSDGTFEIRLRGRRVQCRKLLISTGLLDRLPPIPDIDRYFGRSVFQCPYCDGWELRGKSIAVYGKGARGLEISRAMTAWTDNIALCTSGPAGLSETDRRKLRHNRIRVFEQPILRLVGRGGKLKSMGFSDGSVLRADALFFDTRCKAQSHFAESLGCKFNRRGGIRCGRYEATDVPGVFVAGNIIKDVQLSVVAAAQGAQAAFGINRSLTREDFERQCTGRQAIDHPDVSDS